MREQINENPAVQGALVGLLLLACAFMLYTRVLSGGSSAETAAPPPATSSDSTAPAPPAPAGAPVAEAPAAAPGAETPGAAAPSTPPGGTEVGAGGLEAGKGMPQPVVDAWDDDKAIVVLIVRQAGADDKRVKASVRALEANSDVAVFVTGARNVARYSQIANGVGVSRVPALIVMKPRSVSDGVPTASVSYGFRGPASVVQAVTDSLYEGRNVPYFPE